MMVEDVLVVVVEVLDSWWFVIMWVVVNEEDV